MSKRNRRPHEDYKQQRRATNCDKILERRLRDHYSSDNGYKDEILDMGFIFDHKTHRKDWSASDEAVAYIEVTKRTPKEMTPYQRYKMTTKSTQLTDILEKRKDQYNKAIEEGQEVPILKRIIYGITHILK